jgi:hypothetical protein
LGMADQRHAPGTLPSGKRTVIHCTGGWMGPTSSVDRCRNLSLPRFDLRTVQPTASLTYPDDEYYSLHGNDYL